MMQGGGGGNGIVAYPTGASYTGDKPALSCGFAVASTDSGHKAKTGGFDFTFMRDQQAYLDFAYMANAEVAGVAKQIIDRYYARPAAYSYFVGCSTGGREGMILSQRLPTVFNGLVSGDPHRPVEPRDCTVDSCGLQPGISEGRVRQARD
jgi:feruloyl esterase